MHLSEMWYSQQQVKLGPESNGRLRSKMAKFSDMLPEERERKEYLIKTIFKLSQLINFKCVVDTVDNFIDFQDNSGDSIW